MQGWVYYVSCPENWNNASAKGIYQIIDAPHVMLANKCPMWECAECGHIIADDCPELPCFRCEVKKLGKGRTK
jgi:rubrerythrin